MTDPTPQAGSALLADRGLDLAIAALAGIAAMAQQALGDLRSMGFGGRIDQYADQYADPARDTAIAVALSAASSVLNDRERGDR